jgi:hypothetical protein
MSGYQVYFRQRLGLHRLVLESSQQAMLSDIGVQLVIVTCTTTALNIDLIVTFAFGRQHTTALSCL